MSRTSAESSAVAAAAAAAAATAHQIFPYTHLSLHSSNVGLNQTSTSLINGGGQSNLLGVQGGATGPSSQLSLAPGGSNVPTFIMQSNGQLVQAAMSNLPLQTSTPNASAINPDLVGISVASHSAAGVTTVNSASQQNQHQQPSVGSGITPTFVQSQPYMLPDQYLVSPSHVYTEFKCDTCEFRSLRLADVQLHRRSVHQGHRVSKDEMCDVKNCLNTAQPHPRQECIRQRPHVCGDCGSAFLQRAHLNTHIKNIHQSGVDRREFQCDQCAYAANGKATLAKHIRCVHVKERPHACTFCEKRFGQKVHLASHVAAIHVQTKPFVCPYDCGYRSSTKGLLVKHAKTVHLKEKPFACEYCASKFGQKAHLKKHVTTIHLKERPHKCEECQYTTGTRSALDRHVTVVHRGEKSFQCQICSSAFGQKDHLIKHVKSVHRIECPFKCIDCGEAFKTIVELKRHSSQFHMGSVGVQSATISAAISPTNANPTSTHSSSSTSSSSAASANASAADFSLPQHTHLQQQQLQSASSSSSNPPTPSTSSPSLSSASKASKVDRLLTDQHQSLSSVALPTAPLPLVNAGGLTSSTSGVMNSTIDASLLDATSSDGSVSMLGSVQCKLEPVDHVNQLAQIQSAMSRGNGGGGGGLDLHRHISRT